MIEVFDPKRLGEFSLFHGLTENQLTRIQRAMHSASYPAKTHLLRFGEPSEAIYIVQSGVVKISIPGSGGNEVILGFQGAGEVLGEISLVDGEGHSVDVYTHERSTLYRIDSGTMQGCMETMPSLYRNIANVLARHARLGAMQMHNVAKLSIDGRVAHWLLMLADKFGERGPDGDMMISIRLTQADIANCVDASRVRVNQTLCHFTQSGFISVEQNQYTIRNRDALLEISKDYADAK